MRALFVVLLVVVGSVIASRDLRSCGSCGMECENACGTRNFKTCCFNYMRKRSDMSAGLPLPLDPSLRLELWLARSRSPLYQRILQKAVYDREQQNEQNGGFEALPSPNQPI